MDPYGPKRRKSVAFVVARSASVAESLKDLGGFLSGNMNLSHFLILILGSVHTDRLLKRNSSSV